MSKLSGIREWLKGKKTYIGGVAAILGFVVAWSTGEITTPKLAEVVVEAILAMTVRAGVAKINE
jgi:hypothetical protein